MDAKEKLLNVIEERLTVYANWVNQGGGIRSDASEDLYRELLNTAMGYDLRNMNWVADNFPAIDLGDAEERLAVQVTSTGTADKVKKTLKRFYDHELNRDYDRLIVLIAGKAECKPLKFDHPGVELEIWGTAELIQEFRRLPMKVLRRVEALLLERVDAPQMRRPLLDLPVPERRSPVGFLGREKELTELRRRMDNQEKPVILAGLGGVGKTMLASHFARKWRGNTLFVRFDGSFTRTLADGVGRHIPPQQRKGLSEEAVAELVLELLGQYGADDLLIVDNAEVPGVSWRELTKDPCYAKLRELPMKLLMTTRNRDTGGLWIGNLEDDELREIFRRHDAGVEEPMMDALIRAVGGHTMTVDMIARTIRESWGDVTPEDILTAMENCTLAQKRYDEIENDHDPEQRQIYAHLKALFDLSGISEDGRQALRCATLLPQDGMDAALFRNALPEGARDEIKKLEKRGWVDLKNGLVKIHPVVRLVCRTELVPTDENCRTFLVGLQAQYDLKQYDAAKFCQLAGVFTEAADVLEDRNGFWASEAGKLWNQVGEVQRVLAFTQQVVEKLEIKQTDPVELAAAYSNVGAAYYQMGMVEKAYESIQKTIRIVEQKLLREDILRAISYSNLGTVCFSRGQRKKAFEYAQKAFMIAEKVCEPDDLNLAYIYRQTGRIYRGLGKRKRAHELFSKALRICENALSPNHPERAVLLNEMGVTYNNQLSLHAALRRHLDALAIAERALPENHLELVQSYKCVGLAYSNLGDMDNALVYYIKGWEICEKQLPRTYRIAIGICSDVATCFVVKGEYGCAAEYLEKGMAIEDRFTEVKTCIKSIERVVLAIVRCAASNKLMAIMIGCIPRLAHAIVIILTWVQKHYKGRQNK